MRVNGEPSLPWAGSSRVDLVLTGDEFDIILKALETYCVCQYASNEPSLYIQKLLDKAPRKLKLYDEPDMVCEEEDL